MTRSGFPASNTDNNPFSSGGLRRRPRIGKGPFPEPDADKASQPRTIHVTRSGRAIRTKQGTPPTVADAGPQDSSYLWSTAGNILGHMRKPVPPQQGSPPAHSHTVTKPKPGSQNPSAQGPNASIRQKSSEEVTVRNVRPSGEIKRRPLPPNSPLATVTNPKPGSQKPRAQHPNIKGDGVDHAHKLQIEGSGLPASSVRASSVGSSSPSVRAGSVNSSSAGSIPSKFTEHMDEYAIHSRGPKRRAAKDQHGPQSMWETVGGKSGEQVMVPTSEQPGTPPPKKSLWRAILGSGDNHF